MHNMIIFRYRAPGLPNIYRTWPKAVCALPLGYIHCKQHMVPWPQAAQVHTPTLVLDPPIDLLICIKVTDTETALLGKAQYATGT